jgi:hypothetical protein
LGAAIRRAAWLLVGAVAVLAAAQWLRMPSVPYLLASAVATALALVTAIATRARRDRESVVQGKSAQAR